MAVSNGEVSVATTATRLDTATAGNMDRSALLVRNIGAVDVYLGSATVTTSNGVPLAAGATVSVDLAASDAGLYGIVASGTCACRVLQVGR